MDLVRLNGSLQALLTLDIITADKDIDMLPYLTLFGQHAVPQSFVPLPQGIENITHSRKIVLEPDLGLAIREWFEVSAKMNRN